MFVSKFEFYQFIERLLPVCLTKAIGLAVHDHVNDGKFGSIFDVLDGHPFVHTQALDGLVWVFTEPLIPYIAETLCMRILRLFILLVTFFNILVIINMWRCINF